METIKKTETITASRPHLGSTIVIDSSNGESATFDIADVLLIEHRPNLSMFPDKESTTAFLDIYLKQTNTVVKFHSKNIKDTLAIHGWLTKQYTHYAKESTGVIPLQHAYNEDDEDTKHTVCLDDVCYIEYDKKPSWGDRTRIDKTVTITFKSHKQDIRLWFKNDEDALQMFNQLSKQLLDYRHLTFKKENKK